MEFTDYMKSIHYASKRKDKTWGYMEYLDLAEAEYCTLYRKGKWLKSTGTSDLVFFGDGDGSVEGRSNDY